MKVLLYADNHFSQYSSILRKRSEKYSVRLENQINSINWVQEIAQQLRCDAICCLGDFFDQNALNAEELTALKDIRWASIPNYFLVGNHELGNASGTYSSAQVLNLIPNSIIIDSPTSITCNNTTIVFIPYMSDKPELHDILSKLKYDKPIVVLSHNDIKGIQYGAFTSVSGFDVKDIENYCSLFINGHVHNPSRFCSNGINLGNLTGQNFGEDANLYPHQAAVVDVDTLHVDFYENPYAINFYKIDATGLTENEITQLITQLKPNSVLSIKVDERLANFTRMLVNDNIIERRVVIQPEQSVLENAQEELLFSIDYREQFKNYVLTKLGNTEVVVDELTRICEGG